MINAKELALQLDRFLKSPTAQQARVQVKVPHGEFKSPDGHFDIKAIYMLQNNMIGARETHRIVLELSTYHRLDFTLNNSYSQVWVQ